MVFGAQVVHPMGHFDILRCIYKLVCLLQHRFINGPAVDAPRELEHVRPCLLVHLNYTFFAAVLAGPNLSGETSTVVEASVTAENLEVFVWVVRTFGCHHALD